MFRTLVVAGLGAGLAYFLDPQMGNGRRARLRDQAMSKLRRGAQDTRGLGQDAANRAYGMTYEATKDVRPTAGATAS